MAKEEKNVKDAGISEIGNGKLLGVVDGVLKQIETDKSGGLMTFDKGVSEDDINVEGGVTGFNPIGEVKEGDKRAVSGDEVYDYLSAKTEETLDKLIKGWVISEAMAISNPTYSVDGNIEGAVITWGDGDIGSLSNVIVGQYGITSIRYYRSNGDYATMNIIYDNKGEFQSQEVIITKI